VESKELTYFPSLRASGEEQGNQGLSLTVSDKQKKEG